MDLTACFSSHYRSTHPTQKCDGFFYIILPMNPSLPILYSFRRCPYAMRARLALLAARINVEIREIKLRNKPRQMLEISAKGTVPVLQLPSGEVIAESLDIMLWALQQHDPLHWLAEDETETLALIRQNDGDFKANLDRYKYADRYPDFPQPYYRKQGEAFLAQLQSRLSSQAYLCGTHFGVADAAILPFIRQFAAVDQDWFQQAPYPAVRLWLADFCGADLFAAAMQKLPVWQHGDQPIELICRYRAQ